MAQYAVEKFAKKMFGNSEVEAALQKMDLLTQEEIRMTCTQTLGAVHGLAGTARIIVDGTHSPMIYC